MFYQSSTMNNYGYPCTTFFVYVGLCANHNKSMLLPQIHKLHKQVALWLKNFSQMQYYNRSTNTKYKLLKNIDEYVKLIQNSSIFNIVANNCKLSLI